MLVLDEAEVRALLDLDRLIDALADAHATLSRGSVSMPARIAALVDEQEGLLGAMPAYVPQTALACKLVTLFPHNLDRHTHQAVILVFDHEHGSPIALMDGTYITATRTAAGSALATRLLAREDASVLAVLGTGVQARAHVDAIRRVRTIEEIRVAARDRAKADSFADEVGGRAVSSWAEAIAGAEIVAATTHTDEPIVRREWVDPGTHVNSVGANPAGRGEVDAALVRVANVAVEARASSLAPPPAGAAELVGVDPAAVVELGELVTGTKPARRSPDEITLYKSVGVAIQDAAAAALVLAAARERSVGHEIELEGRT